MANDPTVTPPSPVQEAPPAPPGQPQTTPTTASFLNSFFMGSPRPGEIVVYHHSNLFYWWPVWFFGFVMAIITYFGDTHMAIVPAGTVTAKAEQGTADIDDKKVDLKDRDILVLDNGKHHLTRKDAAGEPHVMQPTIYISRHQSIGTVYVFILIMVIGITNVHMRGLWSFFVLLLLVLLAILFAVAGWWDVIFSRLGQMGIHINMGGYLLLSTVLFLLWLFNFLVLDRQIYLIFNPGQVRMRLEIGGGETVYDTSGMVVQKQRSDLFRHWILGFGSGDMIIRPSGVAHPIEMPNVLWVGRKVRMIEDLVKEKVILARQ